MKKLFSLLCLVACVFCFAACSPTDNTTSNKSLTAQEEQEYVDAIDSIFTENSSFTNEELEMQIELYGSQIPESYIEWYKKWMTVREETGEYVSIIDYKMELDGDILTITMNVDFETRDSEFKMILDNKEGSFTVTYNPKYTLGEKMSKAGLNTVIGISVVFIVLILISLLIGCFKYISQIEQAIKNKKENKQDVAAVGVDNAISQIVQNEEEELVDDLELVAVISAAIAAYTGTSSDGFVVRSIKKSNKKNWKNA